MKQDKKKWVRGFINIVRRKETAKVEFKEVVKNFFDEHGRRISEGLQTFGVSNANRNLWFNRPELNKEVDFTNRILRLHKCLNIDTEINAKQLKEETERLLAIIGENSQIANIVNGVYLPVVLPRLVTNDLGAEVELYLKGVNDSYINTFSDRKFCNDHEGVLADKVRIANGSRHDKLIERMKQGPVIGIYFPDSLRGFSIDASNEQMLTLPKGFILSGMDTFIAMMMYPDILACDNAPGLNLTALRCKDPRTCMMMFTGISRLKWQINNYSFAFRADDVDLEFFDETCSLDSAFGRYSNGLLFLG